MPALPGGRAPFKFTALLLLLLLAALWLAGGASQADALGQTIVRAVAWLLLIGALLFGDSRPLEPVQPVSLLLLAALMLPVLQLLPMPPALWQALPGREVFAQVSVAAGEEVPWRPLAISPGATVNALGSLIVPLVAFVLVAGLKGEERRWLPGILLGFIVAASFVGLLQFAGVALNNPFINDLPGEVSGVFANRNHFALLVAMGCVLAPAWAFLDGRPAQWRGPTAFGLLLLFSLTILASGSRAGILLGVVALGLSFTIVRHDVRRLFRRASRWALRAFIALTIVALTAAISIGFVAGRTKSIERVFTVGLGEDMRARGLPVMLSMISEYFPLGSGLGGFDPIFRLHEPLDLLTIHYLNHAHNDFLEVALDAGLPGILLLTAALAWWVWASVSAWRAGQRDMRPRLGSALLFLVIISSLFDYPARTPIVMTIIVIAGVWLSGRPNNRAGPALPPVGQHL